LHVVGVASVVINKLKSKFQIQIRSKKEEVEVGSGNREIYVSEVVSRCLGMLSAFALLRGGGKWGHLGI
jgi:hypothetical protein